MTALSANLVASKDRTPNRVALRCDDLQFTYRRVHVGSLSPGLLSPLPPQENRARLIGSACRPEHARIRHRVSRHDASGAVAGPMNPL